MTTINAAATESSISVSEISSLRYPLITLAMLNVTISAQSPQSQLKGCATVYSM